MGIFDCIRNKDLEQLNALLEDGADVNVHGNHVCTPLYFATRKGDVDAVKLLLKYKADTNIKTTAEFRTPLHIVNNYEIAKLLIEQGADVNVVDRIGNTPCHCAVRKNLPNSVLKLFLEKSTNYDERNKDGWTALHYAVAKLDFVKTYMLLQKGANLYTVTKYGSDIMSLSYHKNTSAEIVQLLINHGIDYHQLTWPAIREENILIDAAVNGRYDILKILLDSGMKFNKDSS